MKINEEIRSLSWKEPFASLMLPPFNKIETRVWDTKYRGLVLICASKQEYTWQTVVDISGEKQFDRILDAFKSHQLGNIKGHAVAIGRLIDSRPMRRNDEDACFVEYHSDLWCHVYSDVKLIKPFPWKGTQGWKRLQQDTIDKIELI